MKRYAVSFLLALLAVVFFTATPVTAAVGKDELTFSANLFNPNQGDTVWNATGEFLIGVGKTGAFKIGPSVSAFDLGPVDGTSYGVAGEFGFPKSGLFAGGALHALSGDAKDVADYTAEARLGVKFGGERGFAKLYLSQVWSQATDGAVTDPDGTAFTAGLGLRF
jgi:hypothetical protein